MAQFQIGNSLLACFFRCIRTLDYFVFLTILVALTFRQYDEPSAIRHGGGVRRIPGRTLGGPRTRRSNMHFSSSSGLSALSPSGRESVDPIAELLSQLSGVRRGGPPTSQLQQLQMQMQMDRQQATVSGNCYC